MEPAWKFAISKLADKVLYPNDINYCKQQINSSNRLKKWYKRKSKTMKDLVV